jgi:hypothetical protein
MVPRDTVPWLDADAITEFAHFGPTAFSTEDGPTMVTAVATSQDRDDLAAALVEAGWETTGDDDVYMTDESMRDVGAANWVYLGEGVVIWAPHASHLDVALNEAVATSADLPIIDALARAEGSRRLAFTREQPSACGRVIAAGDDATGGGTIVLGVGENAAESRVVLQEDTYVDRLGRVLHAVGHTLDDGYLVITTAVEDPELRTPQFSATGVLAGDGVLSIDEWYRC